MVAFDTDMGTDSTHDGIVPEVRLEEIANRVRGCVKCPLAETRTNAVPGEGSATAEIMFIGEGPGADEDRLGRPFVGRAGRFLDELIESLPMRREDVYIANVVKCRPPGNRDPETHEVAACESYLKEQIEAIDPSVIVPLGRHALEWFMPDRKITASHGLFFEHGGRVLMPLLHPAAGLRNPDSAAKLREGIRNIGDALLEGIRIRNRSLEQQIGDIVEDSIGSTEEGNTEELEPEEVISAHSAVSLTTDSSRESADAAIFARSQTQEEVEAEARKERDALLEEAEGTGENGEPMAADKRQGSMF